MESDSVTVGLLVNPETVSEMVANVRVRVIDHFVVVADCATVSKEVLGESVVDGSVTHLGSMKRRGTHKGPAPLDVQWH